MRDGNTYRAVRRKEAKETGDDMLSGERPKKGLGKRQAFWKTNKDISPFFTAAQDMLMTGPRSQRPTWRATVKTMRRIAVSPKITLPALKMAVPAIMMVARHARGSWRMFA